MMMVTSFSGNAFHYIELSDNDVDAAADDPDDKGIGG